MKFGYFRVDESSHNYLVPEEIVAKFDKAMEILDDMAANETEYADTFHEACAQFDNEFGKFRIDGIYDYKVVMS